MQFFHPKHEILGAVLELIENLPEEKLETYKRALLVQRARDDDSPDSFAAFYELISGTELPDHCRLWVDGIYDDHRQDRGSLIFSFRGSWKTTTLTIIFMAYRIGKNPERANLILQAGDDSAQKSASAVARIIENHPEWKAVFPHIRPDIERGWGNNGYEVMRTDMGYNAWIKINANRKDPTLVGLGYNSKAVIGKHPDGVLSIDDIHDRNNTVSPLERNKVIEILTSVILPLVVEDETKDPGQRLITFEIAVGTPWTEDDAYHYLRATGVFGFYETPAMTRCNEDDEGAWYFEPLSAYYKLNWPERFSKRVILNWYNKFGQREFGRMVLLDLTVAKETGLRYHPYPHEMIDLTWPTSGGVDYASILELRTRKIDPKDRSKFAMCYGMKLPTGGAVIYDGVVGHVTQMQAEQYVERAQQMFYNWDTCGLEMDGRSEDFAALLSRKPYIRYLPFWTGGKSKPFRHERILAPWLEMGLIRISDADTPFLRELRKALEDYPHGNLDVIDSLYAFAKTIPDVLQVPAEEDTPPDPHARRHTRRRNPIAAFGGRT